MQIVFGRSKVFHRVCVHRCETTITQPFRQKRPYAEPSSQEAQYEWQRWLKQNRFRSRRTIPEAHEKKEEKKSSQSPRTK